MKCSGENLSGGGREPGACHVLEIRKQFLRRQCQVCVPYSSSLMSNGKYPPDLAIGRSLVTLAKASLVKWWKQKANCSVIIERER